MEKEAKVYVVEIRHGDVDFPTGALLFEGSEDEAHAYLDETGCAYVYEYGVALTRDDGDVDWGHGWETPYYDDEWR